MELMKVFGWVIFILMGLSACLNVFKDNKTSPEVGISAILAALIAIWVLLATRAL